EANIDTRRGEIRVRPIDAEGQFTDRVRPNRGGSVKAPRLAFDLNDRVIRARDDTVEGRAHGPAIDDRRDVQIPIDRDVQQTSVDRRGNAPRETAPHAREHRFGDHVAADAYAQLAFEVRR